jgi:hypothetical protein
VKGRNDVQANAGPLGSRVAVRSRPDVLGLPVAMNSRSDAWLAVAPAHVLHYSHTAVIIGTVILVIIVLVSLAMAVAWSVGRR